MARRADPRLWLHKGDRVRVAVPVAAALYLPLAGIWKAGCVAVFPADARPRGPLRRRLDGTDGKDELRELRRRRTEAQTGLNGIMRAVEQGAPYGTFHDRAKQLAREIEALEGQIVTVENAPARAAPRPTSSRALYVEVLDHMERLLGAPEVLL